MQIKINKYLILLIAIFTLSSCGARQESMNSIVDKSLDFSVEQSMSLYKTIKEMPEKLPRTIDSEGAMVTSNDKWWTSGFFPGTLWYLYHYSNESKIKTAAREITQRVVGQQYTTDNHDVGFIINCSFGNAFRFDPLPTDKEVIINAAHSLSSRFNPIVGCIQSWDRKEWEFPVIIDNMMNLELLCKATQLSGDSSFYKIAISHADTTLKYHYRPDGSCYHVLNYDKYKGGSKGKHNHQGAFDESTWARGQAWGLYGYTMMYRETGKTSYLEHAVKIANLLIHHPNLPQDKIPYWDFNAPNIPNELRDASAAAIMSSALLELSTFVSEELSANYRLIAEQQIRTLSSKEYLATKDKNAGFILKHGVGFMAKNSEVDVPLSYADYYYVEALIRYRHFKK